MGIYRLRTKQWFPCITHVNNFTEQFPMTKLFYCDNVLPIKVFKRPFYRNHQSNRKKSYSSLNSALPTFDQIKDDSNSGNLGSKTTY